MLDLIDIARLEERRQAISVSELAREFEMVAGGRMCYDAPGSWSNEACGLGLDGAVGDGEIDRLVAFYASRGCEAKVDVCPFADESLIAGLAARGFVVKEFENVLAREVGTDDARLGAEAAGPGFVVERVDTRDEAMLDAFLRAAMSGFIPPREDGSPGEIPQHMYDISKRCALHPRTTSFVALVDGRVVGGGAMEVAEPMTLPPTEQRREALTMRVSCLFGTSVLPEFRRRGIQRALIAARCAHAASFGPGVVCIHSKPGIATERNAMRLGFACAYSKAVMVRGVEDAAG
ncbi:MAG: GNAT family N-acetyltransferase [Phycisphaerales bacterium]|nr:GNAT family N-acetyltransferase [Phycisphaerales bacterium]